MKINEKYKPLWTSKSRYFIVTGGRGSSKSFTVNTFLSQLGFEQWHKILFTRYTLTAASKSIIPEFLEKVELQNMQGYYKETGNEITNITSGSSIMFSGIKTSSGNQTANLKSLQGVSTWVLDEAEELVDEQIFDTIDLSIRESKVQNRVIVILNPTTKEHWIYKKFFEDRGVQAGFNGTKGDTTYIHTSYLDNINNLSTSFLTSIEVMKKRRPDKFKHQILGGWLDKAEGVVFNNWTIGEFNNDLTFGFGQDYGFSTDPTTLVKVAVDTKQKKIYIDEKVYQAGLKTADIIELNKHHAGEHQIIADSAEPRLIAEIEEAGLNIEGVKKGAGSILEGIQVLQDYDLIVTESSINTIRELNNYAWQLKNSKPIDNWNHILDAIRYYVTHTVEPFPDMGFVEF